MYIFSPNIEVLMLIQTLRKMIDILSRLSFCVPELNPDFLLIFLKFLRSLLDTWNAIRRF